jgi:hypothetical protein
MFSLLDGKDDENYGKYDEDYKFEIFKFKRTWEASNQLVA